MRLVVIGGVAAGLSAAARARRLDPSAEIVVLEKGAWASYGACGLPYYVEGIVRSLDQLVTYTPEYFRRERNIEVRTGANVARIEHGRRRVLLAGGEEVRYDRLVIATGARPVREVSGADQSHVFTLNTPDDARALREFLTAHRPKSGMVIGAGYIGLEAAEALRVNGVSHVAVVDAAKDVFDRSDPHLIEAVRKHLEKFGIELRLGEHIRDISDATAGVVVLAAGLKPNVELAVDAGIECGHTGAIRTDERLETSLAGIFAAGDCAETRNIISGKPVWMPLGTTANKMGRIAGANAVGGRERFAGIAGTSIVRVCGVGIAFTGLCTADARAAGFDPVSARIEAGDRAGYFRPNPTTVELTADRRTGRMLGATVIGEREVAGRIGIVATALAARMSLDDFAQLDLAYAPPFAPVWDPLLIAAQQLLREL